MRPLMKLFCFTLVALLATASLAPAAQSGRQGDRENEVVLVGRIGHVDGKLLRYVPEDKDWVATVKDAPFGLDDALYSEEDATAEFTMPNAVWLRVGGSTQVQLIVLKPDYTEVDVASGIARFYNRSRDGVIKATTPFGYVMAPAGSVFDLYVGDESVEVISLKGDVDFVDENEQSKYSVASGSTSIVADSRTVVSGEGEVDAEWDDWNSDRDTLWSKRVEVRGDSVEYLPEPLHDDAYELEENGRWETVEYQGQSRRLWRPTTVAADWRPFSAGRWTVYHEDHCWVPSEPFGYVTHHYGNWVHAHSHWYWMPPAPIVTVAAPVVPAVSVGFGWYPGRVAWVHHDVHVGWVPLAPTEVYYTHRYWGPRAVVVSNVAAVSVNIGGLAWVDHAVVVPQRNLYVVNNYRPVLVGGINRTVIVNNYRSAPVINNTVINNYNTIRERHAFNTTLAVHRRPHQSVLNRINRNEQFARRDARINGRQFEQRVAGLRQGEARQAAARLDRPRVSNRLVDKASANKPLDQVRFDQRQLKAKTKPVQDSRLVRDENHGRRLNVEGRTGRAGRGMGEQGPGRELGSAVRRGGPAGADDLRGQGRQDFPGGRRLGPRGQDDGEPGQAGQGRRLEGVGRPARPGTLEGQDGPGRGGQERPGRPDRPRFGREPADDGQVGGQGQRIRRGFGAEDQPGDAGPGGQGRRLDRPQFDRTPGGGAGQADDEPGGRRRLQRPGTGPENVERPEAPGAAGGRGRFQREGGQPDDLRGPGQQGEGRRMRMQDRPGLQEGGGRRLQPDQGEAPGGQGAATRQERMERRRMMQEQRGLGQQGDPGAERGQFQQRQQQMQQRHQQEERRQQMQNQRQQQEERQQQRQQQMEQQRQQQMMRRQELQQQRTQQDQMRQQRAQQMQQQREQQRQQAMQQRQQQMQQRQQMQQQRAQEMQQQRALQQQQRQQAMQQRQQQMQTQRQQAMQQRQQQRAQQQQEQQAGGRRNQWMQQQ